MATSDTNSVSGAIAKGTGVTVLAVGGMFVMLSISPLFGALSGWVVSIIFPNWVSGGFSAIGLHVDPNDFYKVGAMLGWVGGFIRYSPKATEK